MSKKNITMPNILIIENEKNWRNKIEYYILKLGFNTHFAGNFSDAKHFIKKNSYSLIVLDIHLYDYGDTFEGIFLIELLKKEKLKIPVIIVSAYLQNEYTDHYFNESGINITFLQKQSFSGKIFQEEVNRLIAKASNY